MAGGKFAELKQLVWIRLFVNAIERRLAAGLELAADKLVGEQHHFLDKLVRDVVLDPFEADRPALIVEPDFELREIKVERAGGKPFLAQDCGDKLLG